ncbi:MAG: polysaccharide biosynthesis protein [Flavobacteriales bacterium]|nr:polysaccharide biosynthesis protein [Flavobacteriales bacterium]
MLKFILRESILYTLANYTAVIANLFITPLITPMLQPEDYAILALFHAVGGAISPLGNLGLIFLFQTSFFKDKENWKSRWKDYLGFLHVYRILYMLMIVGALIAVLHNDIPRENWLEVGLLIIIPIVFLDMVRVIGMRLCQWQHNHRKVHITTAVSGLSAALVSLYTIRYLNMGYIGWFYSLFTAAFIQFIFYAYILFVKEKLYPNFYFPIRFMRERLKVALPMVPHQSSAFLLDTSDRLMMKFMNVSMSNIGLYSIAYSFGLYFNNFNGQITTVLSPIYFQIHGENKPEGPGIIRGMTWIWLAIVLVGGFLLSIWTKELFHFLYRNDELNVAYPYSIFIIMALCYKPMYSACMNKVIFEEKTKAMLKISLVGGIINVILNLILIPIYGFEAAIFTTFFSYMYIGFSGFYLKGVKEHITLNYRPMLALSAIIGASFLAYYCVELAMWYKVGISVLVVMFCVVAYFKKGRQLVKLVNSYKVRPDQA